MIAGAKAAYGGTMTGRTSMMKAMVLDRVATPLRLEHRVIPNPGPGELLIAVEACGVCRTDCTSSTAKLTSPTLPLIPGHEVVGRVAALGGGVQGHAIGDRVGAPWLGAPAAYVRTAGPLAKTFATRPSSTAIPATAGLRPICSRKPTSSFLSTGCGPRVPGAAPLRRADRMAVPCQGRRWPAHRTLRLRGCRPHPVPDHAGAGPRSFCFYPAREPGGPGFRPVSWCGVGRRLRRRSSCAA